MKRRKATVLTLALAGLISLASAVPPPNPDPPLPPPKDGPPIKACDVKRPHKPHDWRGPGGKLFHCPGVPD